jgi:Protein of unknown function (Hypoth_ymh)
MASGFSDKAPDIGKPRLRWPGDPTDRAVISMNAGLRQYAPGIFMTVRNMATHQTDEIIEQVGLEQLAALSLLSRWIEQCELNTVEQPNVVDSTGTRDRASRSDVTGRVFIVSVALGADHAVCSIVELLQAGSSRTAEGSRTRGMGAE